MSRNLRHLRLFAAVAELKSVTLAAEKWHVSQPAVTQALNKLELQAGGALFERSRTGLFPTSRAEILLRRVDSAFALLDPISVSISPRLRTSLTYAQLQALVAVSESENFTLAARQLGLAQPTVHRAVTHIEQEAARTLFERTAFGIIPTRLCQSFARAARLAIYELDQADAELAELDGGEAGSLVIGAMPLARSVLLPSALARFRQFYKEMVVRVIDGPYQSLLGDLRRGSLDLLVGALRDPAPIADIVQVPLFDDRLALLARPGHPLTAQQTISIGDLLGYPWVVPHQGTPTRSQFETFFSDAGSRVPSRLIEAGSLLLMRGLLLESDHLGCISQVQARPECDQGLLVQLPFETAQHVRPIGLTYRTGWRPTRPQQKIMDLLEEVAEHLDEGYSLSL
ncbi:DNA-binding transcriptional LysR family regulator [Pseudorhizobium tarimense]|uniref:DNA-binding transcriptional LysR family regulator n=1 Tax=Pseudorhizobium tarimense TaxID=1079109 RepID=A0ABV2HC13_9HYPH|nr:LysR family transcriptional regulator [Pseudorhizobium tarimense]MCJ8520903.1 LysR family transcriptional regulator [Pseudorhizobium tarimense]